MDNSFIIHNLLQQNEGVRLEFKAKPGKDAVAKTITAFVNTDGGDLIIGINDDKSVVGVANAEKVCEDIQKILVENIKPNAPISSQVISYKGKDVILISVWEGAKKPYQFKGTIYSRENDTTKASNYEMLNSLIKDRKNAEFHWERRPVLGATVADLDIDQINETIKDFKNYKTNAIIEDVEDFLIQMGLMQNGNLTNACIVAFGKSPVRYIPQTKVRVTIYPSDKSGDIFVNDKVFEGNIFKNIVELLSFFEYSFGKHIVVDGLLRKETYNYPLMSVREGLLNALVHRDYSSVNSFMQISIFTDRTEISNYGSLPYGITVKDLIKEHSSILRNPDIAQICFIRKYIEMLGSGTLRMISDCKNNGFKTPVWSSKNNITTVIFTDLYINSKINEGVSEGVSEGVNKVHFETESEGVNSELNDLLTVIKKSPGLKSPQLAQMLDKGKSTVERYLKILKDKSLIEFKGAPKTGGYYLNFDQETMDKEI